MIQLRTAQNYTIPVNWIGISDFDGSLRFETPETDLAKLFSVFSDPKHTAVLTRICDEDENRLQRSGKNGHRGYRNPADARIFLIGTSTLFVSANEKRR